MPEPHAQRESQGWLLPSEGARQRDRVAWVALRNPSLRLSSFGVPDALIESVHAGALLRVPARRGAKPIEGWCVRIADEPWDHTRPAILSLVNPQTLLDPARIELSLWIADYYLCAPGLALDAVASAVLRASPRKPRAIAAPVAEPSPGAHEDALVLTPDQQRACAAIAARVEPAAFQAFLLFGAPGSGKTEVYVRAARSALERNREVIILVPEIALATQVVQRLARRFERVAILHSRLTEARRRRTLRGIAAGEFDVVIGTRTAAFAPCRRLGLIVVDEEQESSFKNLAAPFYHARDVALKRAQIEGIPIVLGSATPSLETWHNAHTLQHFDVLRLPTRIPGAAPPQTRIVTTRTHAGERDWSLLTPQLRDELSATFAAGQQSVLLHNRRGFSTVLRCERCGLTLRCPRCAALLVEHRSEGQLKCHRCGRSAAPRTTCSDDSCRGELRSVGSAIERLEQELRRDLPAARLLRLDSDSMKHRDDYAIALATFERREADILIGTQMVAKGLDFPGVRLVGVLEADAALDLPDFRAAERVFHLLVQVVGRAGRAREESLALIQSSRPDHPVLLAAVAQDYEQFARNELEQRRALNDPPLTRLARLILLDERAARVREETSAFAERLRGVAERLDARVKVDDPGPCAIPRLRELWRWQLLLRGPRGGVLQRILHEVMTTRGARPRVRRLTIDVDPVEML